MYNSSAERLLVLNLLSFLPPKFRSCFPIIRASNARRGPGIKFSSACGPQRSPCPLSELKNRRSATVSTKFKATLSRHILHPNDEQRPLRYAESNQAALDVAATFAAHSV